MFCKHVNYLSGPNVIIKNKVTEDAGRAMMEGEAVFEILNTRVRKFKVQSLDLSVLYMACATDVPM